MKKIYVIPLIINSVFLVFTGMASICYADSGPEGKSASQGSNPERVGSYWQFDNDLREKQRLQDQSQAADNSTPKNGLPAFKRQSNRTGPVVEDNGDGQMPVGQIQPGTASGEDASTSQLPEFKPVASKNGPVASSGN